jgi:hypothetical protein
VADDAVLERTISYDPEPTPDTDTDSEDSVLILGALDLLTVDIGTGDHPLVLFDTDESTNEVVFDLEISGLLNVGLLDDYVLIIERDTGGGNWERADDLGGDVDANGILSLDVLGLGSTSGQVTLEDIPPGEYRAALVPDPGLATVGVLVNRELSVTATDLFESVDSTNPIPATGNFITDSASGDLTGLEVVSVDFNGTPHDVTGGNATIVGDFGTLEISSDGTYTYTPDTGNDTDGTDSFTVTVEDTIDGGQVSADLDITVDVQDTEALAPLTANAIMLDGLEDPSGDDTDPSETGEKVELADNFLLDDAAPTIDLGDEIRSELENLASLFDRRGEDTPDLQALLLERIDHVTDLLLDLRQEFNDEQPI